MNIQNTKQSKIVFGISFLTLLLVIVFKSIDVYKNVFVGAVFEMLWLFIVSAIFVIPIVAILGLFKNKFSIKSYYFLTLLISIVSLIVLFNS